MAMAFTASSFSCISSFPKTLRRNSFRMSPIGAVSAAEPSEDKLRPTASSSNVQPPATTDSKPLKKPVYSMKKGQIVRVEKEKYLNSVNYLSVGHPPYYRGLNCIYEDRGEVLDIRVFETGEYALIAWVGAWGSNCTSLASNRHAY